MKRRAALYVFGTVFGVLVLTLSVLQSRPFEHWVRGHVQAKAAAELGAIVRIGNLQIRLLALQPRVELYDVEVIPREPGKPTPEDAEPSFQATIVRVVLRPLQYKVQELHVERIELEEPHLDLVQKDGKWVGLPPGLFIEKPASGTPATFTPRVDAVVVKGGILHLTAETADLQLGLMQVDALGTFEGNGRMVVDLAAGGRRVMMKVGEDWFEEFIQSVDAQVVISKKSIELRGLALETDSLSVDADGEIALGGKTDVRLSRLHAVAPLEFVERVAPQVPPMEGELTWTGSVAVDEAGFRLRGRASVNDYRLDRFHFGPVEADVEVTPDGAIAERAWLGGAGGSVEGPLQITWPNGKLALAADLALQDASFARVLDVFGIEGSHVDAGLGGRVAFSGGLSPLAITGTAAVTHDALTWRDRAWNAEGPVEPRLRVPAGEVQGAFTVTPEGIRLENVGATAGSTGLTLAGDLLFEGAVDLRFAAAPLALGEISPVGPVEIAGIGPASGRLHGEFREIVLEADLDLDGMRVAGFDFGHGTGPLRFSVADLSISSEGTRFVRGNSTYGGPWKVSLAEPPSLDFRVTTTGARVEDLADVVFGELGASRFVRGLVSGTIALSGPFDRLDGRFDARGVDLVAGGERFASYRARGRWRTGDIWLDDLVATKASGAQLFARGSLGVPPDANADGLGGTVNLEAHTASWKLSDLDALGEEPVLASEAGLRLHVGGRFYRPELKGRLDLGGTRLYGQPVGASQLDFDTRAATPGGAKDRLVLEGRLAGSTIAAKAEVRLVGPETLPYTATIAATRHGLKPYLMSFNPRIARDPEVKAVASGTVQLAGDLRKPGTTAIDVIADLVLLQKGTHQLYNDGPLVFSTAPGRLDLTKVALKGEDTALELSGGKRDGRTDIRAKGHVDLAFADLLTDAFTRVEGVLHIPEFRILGGPHGLDYTGVANIEHGTFKTRFFPVGPEDVTATVRVENQKVTIASLAGKLGGGTIDGSGSITFGGPGDCAVQRWDLGPFHLQDVRMRFPRDSFDGRVSGPLRFEGSSCEENVPEIAGDLVMEEARYYGPIEWKAATVSLRRGASVVSVASDAERLFRLNVMLHADGDVWVRNDLGNIELRTKPDEPLALIGDNTAWGIGHGVLELVRGKIAFQAKEFNLTQARINFDDPRQIDFTYDITADTLVRDWQITMQAQGRRSRGSPQITVTSNPPLSPEDIHLLLIAGLTAQELKASGQDPAAIGTIVGTTLGQGLGEQRGITSRLKKVLKADSFDVVPSYTEGGSIGIKAVGRSTVNDDLSLSYSVGQSDRVTGSVQADYRLSRRVHIVGGWSNEEQRTTVSSEQEVLNDQGDVSLDARFRFEWK